jgi:hypothetical protein
MTGRSMPRAGTWIRVAAAAWTLALPDGTADLAGGRLYKIDDPVAVAAVGVASGSAEAGWR